MKGSTEKMLAMAKSMGKELSPTEKRLMMSIESAHEQINSLLEGRINLLNVSKELAKTFMAHLEIFSKVSASPELDELILDLTQTVMKSDSEIEAVKKILMDRAQREVQAEGLIDSLEKIMNIKKM